jgi:hypothetical protein
MQVYVHTVPIIVAAPTTTLMIFVLVASSVSFYSPLARTTQKTQSLLLRRSVYWFVASNGVVLLHS